MRKLLFVLMVMALALTSCSKKSEEEQPAAVEAEPVVFTYNNSAEPSSLDPAAIEGTPEHSIYMCLFEGLVTYDPKTLNPVPGVAESWEVSEDALTWTFKLRQNATWSDGVPITAQTFVDSWLRFMAPETAAVYAYLPAMVIKGASEYNAGEADRGTVAIRALDDRTFQFDLNGPAPYVLGMLTHYSFAAVPLHAIEKYGDEWIRPENFVGNGPFTLEEWIPQDKIVVTKSETYWDAEAVQLDKIIIYPIEDENTALNMYLQGEIDWIPLVPDARLDEMKLRDDYHNNATFITYYYQFNTTRKPFDDPRVRKAMALSIDRQELVDRVTRAGQIPAYGLTPPLADYPAVVAFKEDLQAAKELLAEAGFPDGQGFPHFTLIYNTSEGHRKIAEYVQQKWAENLGITCDIENQEWATFLDNRQSQNFEVARAGWQGDYLDPNTFLTDLLHSQSGNNDGKYTNPQYDALLDKASLMPAGPERFAVLREAEEIAIGEDMGVMPFYFYSKVNWIDTNVWGGWYPTVMDVHPLKDIYKK